MTSREVIRVRTTRMLRRTKLAARETLANFIPLHEKDLTRTSGRSLLRMAIHGIVVTREYADVAVDTCKENLLDIDDDTRRSAKTLRRT